ncbi:ABC transporter permease [Pollutimonas bauzanensis]|uniref:Peptide/nickel transport system permease protein n=1 Tax=Pollutimonas bauzanensis TaxID=658167 RepID=A0A1M5NLC9_9BURK|nr:ABC transporter permease [Pollutimonas bauzanensis]SHG89999.1 peptide/nickel transport system permease protein [Pollutimonas bauzanensis]
MAMPVRVGQRLAWTLLQAIPTALGIIILNFLFLQLVPGDAAEVMAAESGSATEATMALLRQRFGLDQPMLAQLLSYLTKLAHFDLGFSPRYNAAVMELVMSRLGNTLVLMLAALGLAFVVGVALGAVMSAFAGKWPDRVLSVFALLLYSTPSFWVGLMAIVFFSVHLGWLPIGSKETIGASLSGLDLLFDRLRHLLLPAVSLATFYVAIYARLTRAAMLEAGHQDFVRTARAKGLPAWRVQLVHILRNALIPITTLAGLHFGHLLGGAVVIETVFEWPGMGRLALDSVMARDFNVLLGILLLASLLVIAANALIDVLHALIDPRIKGR